MIDWSKPIETDELLPVALVVDGFDVSDNTRWVRLADTNDPNNHGEWLNEDGSPMVHYRGTHPFLSGIRNTQPAETLDTLIPLIWKWAGDRNLIDGATSQAQCVKLFEEGGEVAHAVARGNRDALKDGIGDMIVVLTILAAQNGLTVKECVAAAYDEIKDRTGRMCNGVFLKDEPA